MKKTQIKHFLILIFALLLAIPTQLYSADTTLTQVKLQLKWKHQFQFAGYYAAIEKGFYKNLGLEVELIEANNTELPIDALLSGKAEFATSTSDILLLRAEGKPLVLLATIFQHSAQILLATEASGIEYVHNLAGKKLIIEPHAADIIAYMSNEGITLNKVIQLPHSFDINMLVENKTDAMTAYLTDEPFLLKEQNIAYNTLSPISGNIDFYGDILVTSEELLLKNPKLAKDFRKASLKGWEYAMKNTTEIIELIYTQYSKRHSKEHLAFEAKKMQQIMLPDVIEIGYSNPRRWEKIIKIYQETGMLHENASIKGLFYTDYLNKSTMPWGWFLIFSVVLLFLATLAFVFYNLSRKLKSEIKERKKTHKTLIESEEKYRAIIDTASDWIWEIDKYGKYTFSSSNVFNILGYTAAEIIGKTPFDFMPKSEKIKIKEQFEKLIKKNAPISEIENVNTHKNGSLVTLSTSGLAFFDENGQMAGYRGIDRDITKRKAIELALKESEMRWHFAVDGSELGLWDWDIPNNKVFFSKQWKKMLGFSDDEIGNTSEEWSKRIHPDDIKKVYADIQKHTDGEVSVYQNEHRLLCKDGTYKWVLSKGISLSKTADGKPQRMLGTHADISKRKKAEQALKNREIELKELNKTKDKFFSIIAHDLRGPFSSMLGFSELLIKKNAKLEKKVQREYFGYIHQGINSTYKLLENLLLWSRSQKGSLDFNPGIENLHLLSAETIELLTQAASKKNIKIVSNITSNISLFADKNMLLTILRNLVSNAIKFTRKEGKITLNTRKTASKGNQKFIQIVVKDTGIGISKEIQAKLFDISENTSTKGTERETGTGLGLILCKEFVEKHSGEIWVESEEGKGSEFIFTLPVSS